MTLELTQIAPQVKAMGQTLANQRDSRQSVLDEAKTLLKKYSTAFAELEERVSKAEQIQGEAVRFSWLGAAPANEALAEYHPAPPLPQRVTVIASDGSQIHPDRHGIALYYLVNIGAIVYQHGSNLRPDTTTDGALFYEDKDLYDAQGYVISPGIVNVKRDVAEVEMLARLAPAYVKTDVPLVTLIDGQLTLRIIDLPAKEQAYYQEQYMAALNALQKHKALISAYIDRPRSSFVLALLHLAGMEPSQITQDALRYSPFIGLTDADLFDDLPPGARTAIFNQRAKVNIDYAKAGHQIHFFYLNTGSPESSNVVRVEIPGWIAKDSEKLNTLHGALLKQTRITGGYPYVLARAHELAIIPPTEREALETLLAINLQRQGISTGVSLKQANKNVLGSREAYKHGR